MLRGVIGAALIAALGLVTAPFLLSSLALDERGISIPGKVFAKSETVHVRRSSWSRSTSATVQYEPPDTSSASFFDVELSPERYDSWHAGSPVALRYLPLRDVPAVPMSGMLREVHALPMVRLADRRTFTAIEQWFTPGVRVFVAEIAGGILLLIVLRRVSSPLFPWMFGAALIAGFALILFYDFPTPTPAPSGNTRQTTGRVKSLSRITRLLSGSRTRGVIADQPVEVVGVEFVPEGRTDPVVAVDLIDSKSVAGLREKSTVAIAYQADSPRTAYIRGASRTFVRKNVSGLLLPVAACASVALALLAFSRWWATKSENKAGRVVAP